MPDDQRSLARLAARASFDSTFLGHSLGVYQVLHGLTDAALAERLGCEVATLANVRLCGAVRAEHFAEDVRAIAGKFGVRADALAEVCRG